MMENLFIVGVGGFLGANARYVLSAWIAERSAGLFPLNIPLGTLAVNVLGSFCLALFIAWVARRVSIPERTRLMIGTGFFGAFTTFSTYANESIALIRDGDWSAGLGNMLITNLLCVIAVVLGLLVGSRL